MRGEIKTVVNNHTLKMMRYWVPFTHFVGSSGQ